MRNNETDACKICRKLSEDGDKPQCVYQNINGANACLSKDRAMLVLLNEISQKIRVGD